MARNLRRLRERQNLSMSAVADRANISKSTLSKLERGIGNPSIDTLWALTRVLDVPFAALFDDDGHPGVQVLRFEDAPVVARSGQGFQVAREGHGFLTRHLLSFEGRGVVEAYVVDLEEGARRSASAHSTGVVEHVIVVSGRVDVGAEGESAILESGDRITFQADRSHHYEALDGPARAIAFLDYPVTPTS